MRIIGIAGGTASGKTTFAHSLKEKLGDSVIISVDSYYKTLPQVKDGVKEPVKLDYDDPSSIEDLLLLKHLRDLRQGKTIECPCYDFKTSLRTTESVTIHPLKTIIVEGILTFYWKEVRDIFDCKIFIDASDAVRFTRRLQRDVMERGRTKDFVENQWVTTVEPAYSKFCAPLREYADYVINGELPIHEMLECFLEKW